MVAPTPLGVDFDSLRNLPTLNLTFPTTPSGIIQEIPAVSNTLVPYLTFMVLLTTFVILFFILSDRNPTFGKFAYSDLRSAVICFGIAAIMGLVGIQSKQFHDLVAVGFFVTMFTIMFIIFVAVENKE